MSRSPIDAGLLEPVLQPFGRSTMLPAAAYVSAEVFAWEQRRFFAASWVCIGVEAELRADGATQRAVVVGGVPTLLVWSGVGPPTAFANTCRHRGHELLRPGSAGSARALVCPYHAWSYSPDGSLLAAPGMDDLESFDPAEHALVPLPVEVWHGWVFVNSDAGACGFAEHVGALTGLVEPYTPERLVLLASSDYEVAANWKILTENYHECYHCPLIHPELCAVSPPESGNNFDLAGAWVGGRMELRDGAETMSLDGRSRGRAIGEADGRHVLYLGLLPNLLLSLHPDYVMTHRLEPLAADRTRVECRWYFPDAGIDPAYAVDFWDLTNRQDWAACESVQRGVASPHFRPGPLAPAEDAVHQFVTRVARGYLQGELVG